MFELLIKIICMMTISITNTKLPTKPIEKPVQKIVQQQTVQETTKSKPVQKTTKPKTVQKIVHLNNHLYVNAIDVEVVETNPQSTYELQCIVNHPYKAAAYQYKNCLYIGDHSDQCFATLPYVKLGDKMYWKGKTYTCTYVDNYAYLDVNGYIRLSDGTQLYDYETIALVTCKTNTTRYIRFFKEDK